MIEIQATGDTTLHTAGKYVSEDILVKVPSGGSASVETCTVEMKCSAEMSPEMPTIDWVIYSTVENGTPSVIERGSNAEVLGITSLTLNNVICGTMFFIQTSSSCTSVVTDDMTLTLSPQNNQRIFSITAGNGETATIKIT